MDYVYKCFYDIEDIFCIVAKVLLDFMKKEIENIVIINLDFIFVNFFKLFIYICFMEFMMIRKCFYSVFFFIFYKIYIIFEKLW